MHINPRILAYNRISFAMFHGEMMAPIDMVSTSTYLSKVQISPPLACS